MCYSGCRVRDNCWGFNGDDKVGTAPVTNTSSVSQTSNPTSSNAPSNTPQYKTFSNGEINFQYPTSWGVLPNTANTMAIVGF